MTDGDTWPIEVVTTVGGMRVTVTVEPTEGDARAPQPVGRPLGDGAPAVLLGGGRPLPPLLFLTSWARLEARIGVKEAAVARSMIEHGGHRVIDVLDVDTAAIAERVRSELRDDVAGLVILGGHAVIPSVIVDALPPESAVPDARQTDVDGYWVWSDDPYVDRTGTGIPDLPVSRIPDGQRGMTCLTQLSAEAPPAGGRAGLRQLNRPFASTLVGGAAGDQPLASSLPDTAATFQPAWFAQPLTYLMLHGSDGDGARLAGEDDDGIHRDAVTIAEMPAAVSGTFFSGCCYGALAVSRSAVAARRGETVADRSPESSFAVAALDRGALAFVGCTAVHYSPRGAAPDSYGAPLHAAFFDAASTMAPAAALWSAKQAYLHHLDGLAKQPIRLALSTKILRQFTCLGLGW